jgi:hypothetical protein
MIGLASRLMDFAVIDISAPGEGEVDARIGGRSQLNIEASNTLSVLRRSYIDMLNQTRDLSEMYKDHIVSLVFWYTWLQMELAFWTLIEPKNLFQAIKRIIQLLNSAPTTMSSPFSHHFSGISAHILCQLVDFVDTRDEAFLLLEQLLNTLENLVPSSDTLSFNAAIRNLVSRKHSETSAARLARLTTSPTMGLQHLANAAVNSTATNAAATSASTRDDIIAGDSCKDEMLTNNTSIHDPNDNIAKAAEAAARAAQAMGKAMGNAAAAQAVRQANVQQHPEKDFAPELLSREGYLYALLG